MPQFSLLRQRVESLQGNQLYHSTTMALLGIKQAVNEFFRLRPIIRPLEEPLWGVAPLRALWTYLLTKKIPNNACIQECYVSFTSTNIIHV
jgi:hypothetical protein